MVFPRVYWQVDYLAAWTVGQKAALMAAMRVEKMDDSKVVWVYSMVVSRADHWAGALAYSKVDH